jgi:hypothetical protein
MTCISGSENYYILICVGKALQYYVCCISIQCQFQPDTTVVLGCVAIYVVVLQITQLATLATRHILGWGQRGVEFVGNRM